MGSFRIGAPAAFEPARRLGGAATALDELGDDARDADANRHRPPSDPLAVEARWQELRDRTRGLYPLSDSIVALLDVAFWDIAGKAGPLRAA